MNGKIGTEEPRLACLQMKSKYYTTIEDVLFLKDEGLPGGGLRVPLFPMKIYSFSLVP